jgi:hypothetical protein
MTCSFNQQLLKSNPGSGCQPRCQVHAQKINYHVCEALHMAPPYYFASQINFSYTTAVPQVCIMSSLASLPDEVLKLVMQHVPLQDRLGSCCLVSKRLHAAATAATQDLSWKSADPSSTQSAIQWITHYGQHLTSLLWWSSNSWPHQQLPCPNLQKLFIVSSIAQLGATAGGQPGVLHICTNLTRLDLHCCGAVQGVVVDGLSSLVRLQHFELGSTSFFREVNGLCSATLPCMQQLTFLKVRSLSVQNLLELAALPSLYELHLHVAGDGAVGPDSVPALAFPASVKKLVLLSPVEAGLLSLVPAGLQDLRVECGVEGLVEGPGSLLSCITRFTHLTQLSILPNPVSALMWPPAGPAYSALTASSNLAALE